MSAVAPAEDGGFLLWAGFYTENGQLIRVDQNGDLIWMRQDVLFDRWFADLQGDGAGGFLLAGGQSYLEPMILRVNANGEAVQRFFNDGPLGGDAVSVSSTPDGGAVAACVRQVSFEAPRYSDGVVRFESNGALRWAVECTAESGSGEPKVRALADGTVIAAGAYDIVVDGKYGSALYVLKLSPEGQVVWRQTIEH